MSRLAQRRPAEIAGVGEPYKIRQQWGATAATFKHAPYQNSGIFRDNNNTAVTRQPIDLGTFLTAKEDPHPHAPDLVTKMTEALTRDASSTGDPNGDEPQSIIRFVFSPEACFRLGIDRQQKENHTITIDADQSEITMSARSPLRQISRRRAIPEKRKIQNPHNEYLSKRFDAKRIEADLEDFTFGENDAKDIYVKEPLHLHQDFQFYEIEVPVNQAVDGGTTVAGFSEDLSQLSDQLPTSVKPSKTSKRLTGNKNAPAENEEFSVHAPSVMEPEAPVYSAAAEPPTLPLHVEIPNAGSDKPIDLESESDSQLMVGSVYSKDPQAAPVHSKPVKKTYEFEYDNDFVLHAPDEIILSGSLVSAASGHAEFIPDDDNLSVNNTFAVGRFISAPRLCGGTKGLPAIIEVREAEIEDDESLDCSDDQDIKESNNQTIFRSKSSVTESEKCKQQTPQMMAEAVTPYDASNPSHFSQIQDASEQAFGNSTPDEPKTPRTKNYSSQEQRVGTPLLGSGTSCYAPCDIPQMVSACSVFSYQNSRCSSRGHSHLSPVAVEDFNERRPLHQANSPKNGFDYSGSSLHEIKSRLRALETLHSKDNITRDGSRSSIHDIKANLRRIVADIDDTNLIIIPARGAQT